MASIYPVSNGPGNTLASASVLRRPPEWSRPRYEPPYVLSRTLQGAGRIHR